MIYHLVEDGDRYIEIESWLASNIPDSSISHFYYQAIVRIPKDYNLYFNLRYKELILFSSENEEITMSKAT
jgi:hypothetical protein